MTANERRAAGYELLAKGYTELARAERQEDRPAAKRERVPGPELVGAAVAGSDMTTAEVLELLGVKSAKTLWDWRRRAGDDNPFPEPRLSPGGRNMYVRAEIEAWRAMRKIVSLRRKDPAA